MIRLPAVSPCVRLILNNNIRTQRNPKPLQPRYLSKLPTADL